MTISQLLCLPVEESYKFPDGFKSLIHFWCLYNLKHLSRFDRNLQADELIKYIEKWNQ